MSEILTRGKLDIDEKLDTTTGNDEFDGWFCVKTDPYPCPCGNFVADYMTCAHMIIVWPEIDDPNLLQMCAVAQKYGRNPKVLQYEESFGSCISYYEIKSNPRVIPHGKIRG